MQDRTSSPTLSLTFFATLLLLVSLVSGGVLVFRSTAPHEPRDLLLPRKTSLRGVSQILFDEGIIRHPFTFKVLLRLTGGHSKVRAGEFRFHTGSSLWTAMKTLYDGEPILHSVTIPEGWTIRQISEALEKQSLVKAETFLKLALSPDSAKKYNLKTPHLEGFLFPETYHFSKVDGEEKILAQMVDTFFSHYNGSLKQDAERLGFSIEKLVTFASIVERETGVPSERPLVASVFHNRLKKRMRLQSDPTTIYGIPDFNGNLTKADLQRPSPYNTYTLPGLPPGPIANPGLASLKAALFPAQTEYLYFVSNNQGSHIFSKTYGEHTRNVNGHQPVLPRRQKPRNHNHAKHRTR